MTSREQQHTEAEIKTIVAQLTIGNGKNFAQFTRDTERYHVNDEDMISERAEVARNFYAATVGHFYIKASFAALSRDQRSWMANLKAIGPNI